MLTAEKWPNVYSQLENDQNFTLQLRNDQNLNLQLRNSLKLKLQMKNGEFTFWLSTEKNKLKSMTTQNANFLLTIGTNFFSKLVLTSISRILTTDRTFWQQFPVTTSTINRKLHFVSSNAIVFCVNFSQYEVLKRT